MKRYYILLINLIFVNAFSSSGKKIDLLEKKIALQAQIVSKIKGFNRKIALLSGITGIAAGGMLLSAAAAFNEIKKTQKVIKVVSPFVQQITELQPLFNTYDTVPTDQEKAEYIKSNQQSIIEPLLQFRWNMRQTQEIFPSYVLFDNQAEALILFLNDIRNKNNQEILAWTQDTLRPYFGIFTNVLQNVERDLTFKKKLLKFFVLPAGILGAVITGRLTYKWWQLRI